MFDFVVGVVVGVVFGPFIMPFLVKVKDMFLGLFK
jgi:F0F1-type ATP synthase assembly protein I